VALAVRIITYATVFNLKLLVILFRQIISVPEMYLVNKMKAENPVPPKLDELGLESEKAADRKVDWPSISEGFEPFPRPEDSLESSKW
jgi:hypothetical protein